MWFDVSRSLVGVRCTDDKLTTLIGLTGLLVLLRQPQRAGWAVPAPLFSASAAKGAEERVGV